MMLKAVPEPPARAVTDLALALAARIALAAPDIAPIAPPSLRARLRVSIRNEWHFGQTGIGFWPWND